MRAPILLLTWGSLCALALLCLGIFFEGLWRDHALGDATVVLPLHRSGDWGTARFRVCGQGQYGLYLNTVNHDPPFGLPYRGRFEARVLDPDGRAVLERAYGPGNTDHVRPENNHWSDLAQFTFDGNCLGSWTLQGQVRNPDPQFDGAVYTHLTIRRAKRDLGLGGVVSYIAFAPALVFLALSCWPAAVYARGGRSKWPLRISGAVSAAMALVLVLQLVGPGR